MPSIRGAYERGVTFVVAAEGNRKCSCPSGVKFLAVGDEHAVALESLPLIHQDPFRRILAAQVLVEPMPWLTHDAQMTRYGGVIVAV